VNSINTQMTAQTPTRFGMPISGSAYATARGAAQGTTGAVALAVRDRHVAGAALVKGAFPGTPAWRPPTC
jgi:hypothetical protein